ncbi:hypothetical protein [Gloeobacter kilaueensis]|uniref:hypothetical protein n=1 Tax=Gloeobacter kilaueensis TaxID=1416614 RepID=UPI000404BC6D|nr:hypothetical protein [Gloeobacter kilaueensis]
MARKGIADCSLYSPPDCDLGGRLLLCGDECRTSRQGVGTAYHSERIANPPPP